MRALRLARKSGWTQLIELATKTIAEGELDKVVLARATDLHFASPVNAAAMMAASRRLNLNCYHFYMAFDGENAFLGSSPERLWRRRDKALRTEALAGTVANHPDDKQAQQLGEWLMADDKNQRENMLVVEDICQRLQADTQTLDVLPPQVLRLRKVTAYPLEHPLECYGYRIEEHDKPGALNAQALKAAGVPPGPLFQALKAGKTIMLEDGRQINGADYLAAPVPGKALAIFGDTGPCDAALDLAKGVDVMVHEATLDITMEAKANSRGHSSTRQAATLAREAGVGKLIITHVSSRYDDKGCQHLLRECRSIFPATELANDFTVFNV